MNCAGTGKTTLAHEICQSWARGECLSEDFDAVLLIPMRTVNQSSLQERMKEYCTEELYEQIELTAGRRCLIILEGLDETFTVNLSNDQFFVDLVKDCTALEKAKILITSRPHSYTANNLNVDRQLEVVGFSTDKIEGFMFMSFPNDMNAASELLHQLNSYQHIKSMCCIPLNLVIITEIFKINQNTLPSTLKRIYELLLVMLLTRQCHKYGCRSLVRSVTDVSSKNLRKMLPGIPTEAIKTVNSLCRLSFHAFFDWYAEVQDTDKLGNEKKWWVPKINFTTEDLMHCGMEVTEETDQFDGFSLLKVTVINDTFVYTFAYLSIQEFLCSIHISLLPVQEQMKSFNNLFHYDKLWLFCLDFATPLHRKMLANGMVAITTAI